MGNMKIVILMVLSQIASGSVNILYKFAVADGMKVQIMVFYRLIFAAAFMAPLALIFERKTRPNFSWTILFQGFINGLLGAALGSNLFAESLTITTATFSTAMSNLTPAVTLILAVILRMESLDIRRLGGKAKLLGTILVIGGALVLNLYKGAKITFLSINLRFIHSPNATATSALPPPTTYDEVWGSTLAFLSCVSYAAWLVIQAKMRQRYPVYSNTALMCLCGAIQAGIYAFIKEKDPSAWKLGWNIRLLTSAYAGIGSSGLAVTIVAWCTKIKGPLYVSSFYPLALIFVAIAGTLVLHEDLHLGSIIGAIFIIMGLYTVLWGKAKEKKEAEIEALKSDNDDIGVIEIITAPAAKPELKNDDNNIVSNSAEA